MAENTVVKKKKSGPWREVWRRLKQNKAAMLGLLVMVILILAAIFADYVAPYGYDDQDLMRRFQTPNSQHWLGTDNFGRDIFPKFPGIL